METTAWLMTSLELALLLSVPTCTGSASRHQTSIGRDHVLNDTASTQQDFLSNSFDLGVGNRIEQRFTNRIVRRNRYPGAVVLRQRKKKLDVGNVIVNKSIQARDQGGGTVAKKITWPHKSGQGWQLDEGLINRHFQLLLKDQRDLDNCAQRQWTPWSKWSACSANCGIASTFRYRDCVFTEPLNGKRDCEYFSFKNCQGKDVQRAHCSNQPPCKEIISWGPWGECSAVCQGNVGVRKRMLVKKSSRGTQEKMPEATQTEPCKGTRADCTGWSQWSKCSVSCRNQVGVRERTLMVQTPEGFHKRDKSRFEMEPCLGSNILCEVWTTWSSWSSCDCKKGRRRRQRKCERKFVFTSMSIGFPVSNKLCKGHARVFGDCTPVHATCYGRRLKILAKTKRRRHRIGSLAPRSRRMRNVRVPGCISGCQGMSAGRYPSCRSCYHYWQCHSRRKRERMCAKRRRWDNTAGKCLTWSSTCPGR